ncbi:MAG: HlyD family type I secretion periplasmic adaptor subunit [Magnetococcales bacterium]|nr:HlyD family type I secretion periplasmic adaptor subunit [Magnetococcales bacterium]
MRGYHRVLAWHLLWQRYRSVWGCFWHQRERLRTDFFNKQEAEFLPARLSLQEMPDSATWRMTGRILMLLILVVVIWSVLGEIDIIVRATGRIIPSARTKTIGSVDTASVKALFVTEGQEVKAGDLLIELNASSSDAEHDKAADAVVQAKLQVARSEAMIEAVKRLKPPRLSPVEGVDKSRWEAAEMQLESQYHDFFAKLTRFDGEIMRYSVALRLATRRAEDFKVLLADGAVARHAWLEKEQHRVDLAGQLQDARNQRNALIAQINRENHDVLNEGHKWLVAAQQDQRRAGEYRKLLKLTAPVDGTVQQLTVHTVGGVVPAAQPLMQIVPRESVVEVEAFLENKDVGFVHAGQNVEVKIDAFEYTKYGTMAAMVKHVSQDAISDEKRGLVYLVKIELKKNHIHVDGRSISLAAGMSVSAEIKTGTRRIIEYVLSPVMKHQREALRER